MPIITQQDRALISSWLKFESSAEDRAAIKKEFGIKDSTFARYARPGKSGRDIIPSRFVGKDPDRLPDNTARFYETLKALTRQGLEKTTGNVSTVLEYVSDHKTLKSAATALQKLNDRVQEDKNGQQYIQTKVGKKYIEGFRLIPNGKGGYSIALVKPADKEPGGAGGGAQYQGGGANGNPGQIQLDPPIGTGLPDGEIEDDPSKYAPGTDF